MLPQSGECSQEFITGPQKRRQYGLSENGGGEWRGVMTAAGTGIEAHQPNNKFQSTFRRKLFLHVIFVITSGIALTEMVEAKYVLLNFNPNFC